MTLQRALSLSKKPFRQAAELFETSKSFKKLFDPTRKGTLTVPFHTIPPSESFGWRVYRQPEKYRIPMECGTFFTFSTTYFVFPTQRPVK